MAEDRKFVLKGNLTRSKIVQGKPLYGQTIIGPDQWPDPILFDHCLGGDHVTLNVIQDWSVYTGNFDPFPLVDRVLKRLGSVTAGAVQTGVAVSVNTLYKLTLSGEGRLIFDGAQGVEWSNNTTNNYIDLTTESVYVSCNVTAPTTLKIELQTNSQTVSSVQLQEHQFGDTYGGNIINNFRFLTIEEHYYDIVGYWKDETDPETVPSDALGWLQGFNDYMVYTIHKV